MQTLRTIAWTFVALALALIGADLISSLEQQEPVIRTTREILNLVPGVGIEPLGTEGAGGAINAFIDLPLWAVVGVVGLLATILIRPVE